MGRKLRAIGYLVQMLGILEAFPTPSSRTPVAGLIIQVFTFFLKNRETVIALVHCLSAGRADIQFEACRALTLFVLGPRIASLPRNHLLHPNSALYKRIVISAGLVPSLLQLVYSQHPEVQQQAVQCIGAIASHNYEPMMLLHENKALAALVSVRRPTHASLSLFVGVVCVAMSNNTSWTASVGRPQCVACALAQGLVGHGPLVWRDAHAIADVALAAAGLLGRRLDAGERRRHAGGDQLLPNARDRASWHGGRYDRRPNRGIPQVRASNDARVSVSADTIDQLCLCCCGGCCAGATMRA